MDALFQPLAPKAAVAIKGLVLAFFLGSVHAFDCSPVVVASTVDNAAAVTITTTRPPRGGFRSLAPVCFGCMPGRRRRRTRFDRPVFSFRLADLTSMMLAEIDGEGSSEAAKDSPLPEGGGWLKEAGGALVVAASALAEGGARDEESVQLMEECGEALIRAGGSWSTDWGDVTDAFADAAAGFESLAAGYCADEVFVTPRARPEGSGGDGGVNNVATCYRLLAEELEDASSIEGCTSVGPPSSVPNLLAAGEHLDLLARIWAKDGGNNKVGESEDSGALSGKGKDIVVKQLQRASCALRRLVEEYD